MSPDLDELERLCAEAAQGPVDVAKTWLAGANAWTILIEEPHEKERTEIAAAWMECDARALAACYAAVPALIVRIRRAETLVELHAGEIGALARERDALRAEVERLIAKMKELEDGGRRWQKSSACM